MIINLCNTTDEKNVIDKVLSEFTVFDGSLRSESSIINPVFDVEIDNPSLYNYCFIPEFHRYYYITDVVSVRTNFWRIMLHVDVLKTFADSIKGCRCILANTEETENTQYIDSEIFRSLVKNKTDIIKFENGLLESGEYILITAGGIGV